MWYVRVACQFFNHSVCHHQVYVDKLVKVAYENWESVVEYEGEALADVQAYPVKGMETYTQDPINGLSGSTFYLQGSHQEHIHLFSHNSLDE
jgi:hypothetical protein